MTAPRLDDLPAIHQACWQQLAACATDKAHAWRVMGLATLNGDVPDLRSDRVYVLDVGQDVPLLIHVIEPKASPSAASRLLAAPAQIAIAPASTRARLGGRTLAFVANFGNSTLGVLDLSDPDPRNHRVAARLGRALSDDGVDEVE